MSRQGSLGIERMCQLAQVSRAGFYRSLQEQRPMEEAMEVRSAIQQVALEHRRRYGYRRVSAELRRRGMLVNHKRVARIMREDNLLAVQPKQFVVTTDSNHDLEVYLNLASRMKLSGINQLWVADITYIRLQAEFVCAGSDLGQPTGNRSSGAGNQETAASTRGGSSLRSRSAICQRRICGSSREAWHDSEYESASEPLRQRQLRKLHQDFEAGGNLRERIR